MKYTMESETIEFTSKNGNKYTVMLEGSSTMSLVDKWNNVVEHEILFHDNNKRDKENIENFITNVVDGIQLNREQEHQLEKFIYDWYERMNNSQKLTENICKGENYCLPLHHQN